MLAKTLAEIVRQAARCLAQLDATPALRWAKGEFSGCSSRKGQTSLRRPPSKRRRGQIPFGHSQFETWNERGGPHEQHSTEHHANDGRQSIRSVLEQESPPRIRPNSNTSWSAVCHITATRCFPPYRYVRATMSSTWVRLWRHRDPAGRPGRTRPAGWSGIDCCEAFLDHARAEVRTRGLTDVASCAATRRLPFPPTSYDFVFARFGTMFFANPVAGLRDMRQALRPGGRMVHIVWRDRADNPWLSMAKDVVLRYLPSPGSDA